MRRSNATSRSFRVFSMLTLALGCLALLLAWGVAPVSVNSLLVLLALATLTAETLALDLPRGGSTSLAYPLSMATTVLLGPVSGAVVASLSALNPADIRRGRPLSVFVFNSGMLLASTAASGWLYVQSGGRVLLSSAGAVSGFTAVDFPRSVVPLAVLGTSSIFVNLLLVAIAISLLTGTPLGKVWRSNLAWTVPMQAALACLGFALAQVLATSLLGFALFVFPLVVSRQMYQRYMGLRDAYRDTVRSLVAAIEAKDPYTRGHSERVAQYTLAIAGQMSLSEKEVERLEFAALLHDLGKVGISGRVLLKKGPLTESEWEEIKLHPSIGARILARVPYLEDIVGAVKSHHERLDGRGYGEGLEAASVPIEARILAVADAYDAMTTARPYRPALSADQAAEEISAGCGSQFDPLVADAFLRWLKPEAPPQSAGNPVGLGEGTPVTEDV